MTPANFFCSSYDFYCEQYSRASDWFRFSIVFENGLFTFGFTAVLSSSTRLVQMGVICKDMGDSQCSWALKSSNSCKGVISGCLDIKSSMFRWTAAIRYSRLCFISLVYLSMYAVNYFLSLFAIMISNLSTISSDRK